MPKDAGYVGGAGSSSGRGHRNLRSTSLKSPDREAIQGAEMLAPLPEGQGFGLDEIDTSYDPGDTQGNPPISMTPIGKPAMPNRPAPSKGKDPYAGKGKF